MAVWIVVCPHCGTENEVPPQLVRIDCGRALADCVCTNCANDFGAEQDYLLWLGVDETLLTDWEK